MIGITAASSRLGMHTLDALLDAGVPPQELIAVARSTEKLSSYAERGVQVRHGDYSEPETLAPALRGVTRLLLVSGLDMGQRLAQHRAVIEAAKQAGITFIAYTSVLDADTNSAPVAPEHLATEKVLAESGITHALLRNGWYIENYTDHLEMTLAHGALIGAAQQGRISAATRADFATAAAKVLLDPPSESVTYELAGDTSFTMSELAEAVSRWSGREIAYHDLSPEAYGEALSKSQLPAPVVKLLVGSDVAISRGELYSERKDLSQLIGRPTTPLDEVLAARPRP